MAHLGDLFRPGDRAQHSGIYRVLHNPEHEEPHEVTVLYGRRFPPCRCCEHTRFMLVRGAESVETQVNFNANFNANLKADFKAAPEAFRLRLMRA